MLQVSYSLTCPFTEPGGTDRLNNSLLSATVKLQEDQQQDVASCWLWNHHHHHHTTNNIQIAPQPAQSTLLLQHVTTTVHCYWWSVVLWGKPQYRQLQGCVLYRCPAQQTGWNTYMYTNMTWQEHQRNFTAAKKVKVLVQILVQNCQVKTGQWYFWAVSGQHNFNFNVHAFYYMFGCMCIILCFGMIIIIRYINMNYTHASIYRLYNFQQDSLVFTKLILFFLNYTSHNYYLRGVYAIYYPCMHVRMCSGNEMWIQKISKRMQLWVQRTPKKYSIIKRTYNRVYNTFFVL